MRYIQEDIDQLRNKLTDHIDYHKGETIRKILHEHATLNYTPKHTDATYMKFMNTHEHKLTVNGFQSTNHPYYFNFFSVVSQHVLGDCLEECLDKAIYMASKGVSNGHY